MPTCFSESGLKFLGSLARHNERPWFEARKHIYEAEVKQPMLDLIAEINVALAGFAPEFVRDPRKCMMRIYRDIRFSKDKRPYKTHAAAWWARQGMEKTSGGGFYLEIGPQAVRVAAGVYMPEREQLYAIRKMLLENHSAVREALRIRGVAPPMAAFDGLPLTRSPKGFPEDHPAADLIAQRQWGVISALPPETATQPALAAKIIKRMRLATPLVSLLNEPLVSAVRKPLF